MVPVSELPPVISTNRFRLPLVSREEAAAALAGSRAPDWHEDYPRSDDLDAFSMIKGDSTWGPRHIVRVVDGLVIGSVGFYGPPAPHDDGVLEVEIGYGLVEYARGHGVATEVVSGLVAALDAVDVRVRARTEPSNAPSLRVLAKCGFTVLRGPDEDGNLVVSRA